MVGGGTGDVGRQWWCKRAYGIGCMHDMVGEDIARRCWVEGGRVVVMGGGVIEGDTVGRREMCAVDSVDFAARLVRGASMLLFR